MNCNCTINKAAELAEAIERIPLLRGKVFGGYIDDMKITMPTTGCKPIMVTTSEVVVETAEDFNDLTFHLTHEYCPFCGTKTGV